MSTVEFLINFVNERLSAAVDEIFTVFENTIVQYEQEVERQRRLLESFWKPQIKLHRIDHLQLHVSTAEEVLADQQPCTQERNSSLDREEPEPPQVKEEYEELYTSQEVPELPQIKEEQQELFSSEEREQLVLKLVTDTFTVTPTYENRREPESNSDLLLSCRSPNQNQEGGEHVDSSGSTANADLKPRKKRRRSESDRDCVDDPHMSKRQRDTDAGKNSV